MKLMTIGKHNYMTGENIYLRTVELSDIDILYSLENDVKIWHLSDTLMPFSRFAMEQYVIEASTQDIYTSKQCRFMICKKSSHTVTGTIDLYDFNPRHQRAGIGILIASDYRRKGYATEALQLIINYGFKTLNLHQFFCSIASDNSNSISLFSKLGFKQTGGFIDWRIHENKPINEYFFQLINPLK